MDAIQKQLLEAVAGLHEIPVGAYNIRTNGKSEASRKYKVALSTLKRWCKKYDGTWESMLKKSHRPHGHPKQHTAKEEKQIKSSFKKHYARYGWDGVYDDLLRKGYTRSFS